jgi:hypothetical protein
LALSVPFQLDVQRIPWRAQFGNVAWPQPFYSALAERPGTLLLEPPFAPEVASAQTGLMYQLLHRKTLIAGHGLWVERVRPAGWDAFVADNSFLSALQRFERAELADGRFRFEAADLRALIDAGAQTAVLNREYFPVVMRDMLSTYQLLFEALFGPPVATGTRVAAYDMAAWNGTTEVAFEPFAWPKGLRPGGPVLAVSAPRAPSLAFSIPKEEPRPKASSKATDPPARAP